MKTTGVGTAASRGSGAGTSRRRRKGRTRSGGHGQNASGGISGASATAALTAGSGVGAGRRGNSSPSPEPSPSTIVSRWREQQQRQIADLCRKDVGPETAATGETIILDRSSGGYSVGRSRKRGQSKPTSQHRCSPMSSSEDEGGNERQQGVQPKPARLRATNEGQRRREIQEESSEPRVIRRSRPQPDASVKPRRRGRQDTTANAAADVEKARSEGIDDRAGNENDDDSDDGYMAGRAARHAAAQRLGGGRRSYALSGGSAPVATVGDTVAENNTMGVQLPLRFRSSSPPAPIDVGAQEHVFRSPGLSADWAVQKQQHQEQEQEQRHQRRQLQSPKSPDITQPSLASTPPGSANSVRSRGTGSISGVPEWKQVVKIEHFSVSMKEIHIYAGGKVIWHLSRQGVMGFEEHVLRGQSTTPALRFESPTLHLGGKNKFVWQPSCPGEVHVACTVYTDEDMRSVIYVYPPMPPSSASVSTQQSHAVTSPARSPAAVSPWRNLPCGSTSGPASGGERSGRHKSHPAAPMAALMRVAHGNFVAVSSTRTVMLDDRCSSVGSGSETEHDELSSIDSDDGLDKRSALYDCTNYLRDGVPAALPGAISRHSDDGEFNVRAPELLPESLLLERAISASGNQGARCRHTESLSPPFSGGRGANTAGSGGDIGAEQRAQRGSGNASQSSSVTTTVVTTAATTTTTSTTYMNTKPRTLAATASTSSFWPSSTSTTESSTGVSGGGPGNVQGPSHTPLPLPPGAKATSPVVSSSSSSAAATTTAAQSASNTKADTSRSGRQQRSRPAAVSLTYGPLFVGPETTADFENEFKHVDFKDLEPDHKVSITDFAFRPTRLTIQPGQTVQFSVDGPNTHKLRIPTVQEDGTVRAGLPRLVIFAIVGSFTIQDEIYRLKGFECTINVEPATPPPPPMRSLGQSLNGSFPLVQKQQQQPAELGVDAFSQSLERRVDKGEPACSEKRADAVPVGQDPATAAGDLEEEVSGGTAQKKKKKKRNRKKKKKKKATVAADGTEDGDVLLAVTVEDKPAAVDSNRAVSLSKSVKGLDDSPVTGSLSSGVKRREQDGDEAENKTMLHSPDPSAESKDGVAAGVRDNRGADKAAVERPLSQPPVPAEAEDLGSTLELLDVGFDVGSEQMDDFHMLDIAVSNPVRQLSVSSSNPSPYPSGSPPAYESSEEEEDEAEENEDGVDGNDFTPTGETVQGDAKPRAAVRLYARETKAAAWKASPGSADGKATGSPSPKKVQQDKCAQTPPVSSGSGADAPAAAKEEAQKQMQEQEVPNPVVKSKSRKRTERKKLLQAKRREQERQQREKHPQTGILAPEPDETPKAEPSLQAEALPVVTDKEKPQCEGEAEHCAGSSQAASGSLEASTMEPPMKKGQGAETREEKETELVLEVGLSKPELSDITHRSDEQRDAGFVEEAADTGAAVESDECDGSASTSVEEVAEKEQEPHAEFAAGPEPVLEWEPEPGPEPEAEIEPEHERSEMPSEAAGADIEGDQAADAAEWERVRAHIGNFKEDEAEAWLRTRWSSWTEPLLQGQETLGRGSATRDVPVLLWTGRKMVPSTVVSVAKYVGTARPHSNTPGNTRGRPRRRNKNRSRDNSNSQRVG